MKKWVTPCIALVMAIICSFSVFALEVPTETVIQNLNGVQQYIKTFTVSPDTDPKELIEEPFDYEGYTYKYASITKAENEFEDEKQQTDTVTVETAKKDLNVVLDALPATVDYDDGRYAGTLYLDHTTVVTEASGYTTQSYTVSTTKEYGNLDSNDMSYVPQTAVKDGKTLPLVNVEWYVQGSGLVDDVLVPCTYKAVATYSSKAYYNAATGYVTTANYTGTVSCKELSSITYTVTYVGEGIQPVEEVTKETEPEETPVPCETVEPEPSPEVVEQDASNTWRLYIIAGLLIVLLAIAAIYFLRYRNNRGGRGMSRKE